MSYVGLKRTLVEDFLARLDKMGMGESVEGRVPLLDGALARWSFGVPQSVKIAHYQQKALMRRVVSEMLPAYVLARPKQGFCPPVADWAVSLLPSRMPTESMLVEDGLIAPDAVAQLTTRGSTGDSFALWTLGTLAIWCEHNLGDVGRRDSSADRLTTAR
jgi:asparagine synthase (glutamine-hydrolysing)